MKALLYILLSLTSLICHGQRSVNHHHDIEIDQILMLDYLNYLDKFTDENFDTVLISTELKTNSFRSLNVKYKKNTFNYIINNDITYLTIEKEQHFENDSTIFIRLSLVENVKQKKKKTLIDTYSVIKYPYSSNRNITSKDFYIQFDTEFRKWQITTPVVKNSAYYGEYGILMDSTTLVQFLIELQARSDAKNEIKSITTQGQVNTQNWLSNKDLYLLYSLIESRESANCITRSISSYIYVTDVSSTIGNHAVHILYCYIMNLPYPDQLNICPDYNQEKTNTVLEWWDERNKKTDPNTGYKKYGRNY